jgi:predicted dehydrogenase
MKIGILGTGFGMHHAYIYKNIDIVESITVFGRNKEKLGKIHKDMKVVVTDNAKDIFANESIDLIDICLPSSIHREYVIEALKIGKLEALHVKKDYCEQSIKHVIECCTKDIPTISSLDDAIKSLEIALQVKNLVLQN